MPIQLNPSIVLIPAEAAAPVLGITVEEVLGRVDGGELVAFDFGMRSRRSLRIWTESLRSGACVGMSETELVDACVTAVYGQRTFLSLRELGRRCVLDRSMLYKTWHLGLLDLVDAGVPRASWRSVLASRLHQVCRPENPRARTHSPAAVV